MIGMDIHKIKATAADIENAQKALEWLNQYGDKMSDAALDKFGFGSAMNGNKEASSYLNSVVKTILPTIVRAAKDSASRDIEACKEEIRQEASK